MIENEGPFNYSKYRKMFKTIQHSHRIAGKRRPGRWLRRPTQREALAAAKRFVRDGEIKNAVEMIKLIFPKAKISVD